MHPLNKVFYQINKKLKDAYPEAATGGVMRKGVITNLAKFTGKHLCQSLFFNKVTSLRLLLLISKIFTASCELAFFLTQETNVL